MADFRKRLTEAEVDRQYEAARHVDAEYRKAGLYANAVHFDVTTRRFILELTNGYSLGVPVATLPEVANETDAVLGTVALPTDDCMEIESLDVQYSVPGLVMAMSARVIGRRGGSATSARKAKASRANGKKGGRPRKPRGV